MIIPVFLKLKTLMMLTFQSVRCLDYCWKSYCHNNFRKFEQPPVITTTFDPHDSSPLVLLSSHLGQAAHHPEPQAVLLPLKAALPPGGVPQEQIYPQSCQSPHNFAISGTSKILKLSLHSDLMLDIEAKAVPSV